MILSLVLMLQVAGIAPPAASLSSTTPLTLADVALYPRSLPFDPYYPERAARLGVSGLAIATCKIDEKGQLRNCTVLSATPARQAFDFASAKILQNARTDLTTKDGAPTTGRVLNVAVRFTSDGSRFHISFE